jgi:mercuric ion transport protein
MMSNTETLQDTTKGPNRLLIGGAGLLALLSASCCVLPIGLSIIGLGGTWLTILGPFVAYRLEILVFVGLVLAWGWFRVWQRWSCASRKRSTVVILGSTTVAFALAASSPLWEEDAARTMFALWRQSQ